MLTPTKREQQAIDALQAVAKRWPRSLWLFSANGSLWVMRVGADGERVMDGESVDQNYSLALVPIPNDGGDF